MKWTFSIKNKLAASVVLLSLCVLVLISHYLDRLHTENVKNSISTMYEDRLIVEHYILKMTQNVYQIREIINAYEDDDNLKDNAVNKLAQDFKATYTAFSKTKLTQLENTTAIELINNFKKFEHVLSNEINVLSIHTDKILDSLNQLSTIQLEESKLIMEQVEAQYASIKTSSQFAFAIIIIILIALQVMVFSGESLIPLYKPKDPSLN
jgi:Na+/phosphate symporter